MSNRSRTSESKVETKLLIYPIVKLGNPVLETEAADVTEFDTPELHKLIEDMFESMYAAKGVGLAAHLLAESRNGEAALLTALLSVFVCDFCIDVDQLIVVRFPDREHEHCG